MDKNRLLEDLARAIAQLSGALNLPADHDVVKAGCIQYFEFSFELAWKTIKAIADEQGAQDCNSPKTALKFAFKNGWLADEAIWLEMLAARNQMAHTYNAPDAMVIYQKLPSFLGPLRQLENQLRAV